MIKQSMRVVLKERCDSVFLNVGDEGIVVTDIQSDGMVAVEFDFKFGECHDCDGLVENGRGWWISAELLKPA